MRAKNLILKRAKGLRADMTSPEILLWARLRVRQPGYPAFRRQHPVGLFILDFYCAKAKLAVEIDGWGHNMGDQPRRDEQRDRWLAGQGIEVLRIPAADVLERTDEVADSIRMMSLTRTRR